MESLTQALLLATLAGAAIPLGAVAARHENIRPAWLEDEFRHSVIAFGGGALIAAISLVLVPRGIESVTAPQALLAFIGGGLAFFVVDRTIARHGGRAGQLLAMLLDFIPEAMAVGAMLAGDAPSGLLLALLIALQNLPEGFNAYREMVAAGDLAARTILVAFFGLVALGPLAAAAGHIWLADLPQVLGLIMLFASGGILYLIFEDIAPQAVLDRHWGPPLGAVGGFALGLLGHTMLH